MGLRPWRRDETGLSLDSLAFLGQNEYFFFIGGGRGDLIITSIRCRQLKKLSVYIYPQTILQKTKFSAELSNWFRKIKTRALLVFWYLYACARYRAVPWNFFQLNSNYFNEAKGIFSKLEMDSHIPVQWRLQQYYFDRERVPETYPVFLKPEWGQNSIGIIRADNKDEYQSFERNTRKTTMPYIVQQAALGAREFEIYYLRSPESNNDFTVFSITQATNTSEVRHPINSIYNPDTTYQDITSTFSEQEILHIWGYLKTIGNFRMARVCIKTNSKNTLLQGIFQIVEINLFLPMPLILLADNVEEENKQKLIREIMMVTAMLVKTIPPNETGKSIFFRKMQAHYSQQHFFIK